jgi:hypothetical protein
MSPLRPLLYLVRRADPTCENKRAELASAISPLKGWPSAAQYVDMAGITGAIVTFTRSAKPLLLSRRFPLPRPTMLVSRRFR